MESEGADELNRLGRLRQEAGDAATAIALQRFVLQLEPAHARAAADLRAAERAIVDAAGAQRALASVLADHPDLACHHRLPGSLLPFAGMDDAEARVLRALEDDPSLAGAHAVLGNLRARASRALAAIDAYRLAAMLDWEWADVHLALSALFESVRDDANAERHRREALSRKTLYEACALAPRLRVLVLAAPGGATANTPLDFCVDHERVALHVYYLTGGAAPPALPAHDAVFNAMDEAEWARPAIERAIRFAGAHGTTVVNDPAHLARLNRARLPETLGGIEGCRVAPVRRISRAELNAVSVDAPLVVRPVDTQRGDFQERVIDSAHLRAYLARAPGTHFNVSPFIEYRSADGYYRKYRVIVVGGRPYPYHLAVSDAWKVHYHSSLMREHAWMRREEERFLRDPQAVFPRWQTVFGAIANAVGLDYFGIDCTVGGGGDALVFECGTGMLVHARDEPGLFGYKTPYVARITAALEALLERAARSG